MSRSGFSATSGSRLFISIRSAASWCQPLQLFSLPRGARTIRRSLMVEYAFTNRGRYLRDVGRQGTVGFDRRRNFADAFVGFLDPDAAFEWPAEFQTLGRCEKLDGEQMFFLFHHDAPLPPRHTCPR